MYESNLHATNKKADGVNSIQLKRMSQSPHDVCSTSTL